MTVRMEPMYEIASGVAAPLPAEITEAYGPLYLPIFNREIRNAAPWILCNFVATIDGVVSLNQPGHSGTGEISRNNEQDRIVMGLLRAVSDAVVAGASVLRSPPGHIWTPEFIYPHLAEAYYELRKRLGKSPQPLNVVVTATGQLDLSLPVFQSEQQPVLILTTEVGAEWLIKQPIPPTVNIQALALSGMLSARQIVEAIASYQPVDTILVEGGPHMAAGFFEQGLIDDLFLTIAPQVAGRERRNPRPGLVEGATFAPHAPLWGKLASVRRGGDYLFLRYQFPRAG